MRATTTEAPRAPVRNVRVSPEKSAKVASASVTRTTATESNAANTGPAESISEEFGSRAVAYRMFPFN